jgi:hypothetical protein
MSSQRISIHSCTYLFSFFKYCVCMCRKMLIPYAKRLNVPKGAMPHAHPYFPSFEIIIIIKIKKLKVIL